MTNCPCGSGLELDACCGPYVGGTKAAPTAEALMRSRYTAFTQGNVAYLKNTLSKAEQAEFDMTEEDLAASTWIGLDIKDTEAGLEGDERGVVEFVARYKASGTQHVLHERSTFCREDGRWVYESSIYNPKSAPVTSAKVGRNDPCPCGSGKKFKKCCGR